MALIGKIVTLFADKEKTLPRFPRTKVSAVSNDDGIGLDVILENTNTQIENNGIFSYTHSSGSLFGSGVNGKFKSNSNEIINNIDINGTTYSVNIDGGMELKQGNWYSFILDSEDKIINFNGGGAGISKAKLIEALQYSNLGLTINSTPEEIFTKLASKFPNSIEFLNNISYSGNKEIIYEEDGNWRIRLLSNGILTFNIDGEIDVFLVGGGGGGGHFDKKNGAGGGGGGYTTTAKNIAITAGEYPITIGGGGGKGSRGGTSTAFGCSAQGGYSGVSGTGAGGAGGSGGGGYPYTGGGSNGSKGGGSNGGAGQGTTTREFGEETGTLYASGGACGVIQGSSSSAKANTGGGGQGAVWETGSAGSGGSGIVVIRNARE